MQTIGKKGRKIVMNAKEDDIVRNIVRKIHSLAVQLKESGFTKLKTYGGMSVPSIRKFFNVEENRAPTLTYIELFELSEKEQTELVEFITDNSKAKIENIKNFTYKENNSVVTRILVDPVDIPDIVQK